MEIKNIKYGHLIYTGKEYILHENWGGLVGRSICGLSKAEYQKL